MNKINLYVYMAITFFVLSFAFFLSIDKGSLAYRSNLGSYLFENSNKEGTNVKKIKLTKQNQSITLIYENKFWHIEEADNYFADLVSVNTLIHSLNDAKIEMNAPSISLQESNLEVPQKNSSALQIQTYDSQNKLLDDVIIGKKQNNFYYARYGADKEIYLISGKFDFVAETKFWLQQPLMSLEAKNIESLVLQGEHGQQIAYQNLEDNKFYNLQGQNVKVRDLLEKFSFLTYVDVKNEKNTPFNQEKSERAIVLNTHSGLIYAIEIYNVSDSYWLKITMSITKLPTKLAAEYIKDSSMLYQNWFFKIDKSLGKYLMEYNIK